MKTHYPWSWRAINSRSRWGHEWRWCGDSGAVLLKSLLNHFGYLDIFFISDEFQQNRLELIVIDKWATLLIDGIVAFRCWVIVVTGHISQGF